MRYARSNRYDRNYFWGNVRNWLFELLYGSSLYPWYVNHLISPFTFCMIIVMYAPARNYCVHLLKSIQFNNSKHYVTIIMTMIVLLIYLAVLNLVLPHGLRVGI